MATSNMSLGERSREVRDQATALSKSVQTAVKDIDQVLERQMVERPYAVLGIAAGVGFVLGGGLSPMIFRRALGLGTKLAIDLALAGALGAAVNGNGEATNGGEGETKREKKQR